MNVKSESRDVARTYPIRAVSRLTGISVDLLRAWERRYQAVRPARSGRGRMYSDSDVCRLGRLRRLVDSGHSIGRIASLSDKELDSLAERQDAAGGEAVRRSHSIESAVSVDLSKLTRSVEDYDAFGFDRELGRLAALLPTKELVRDVVQPVMYWIGEQWIRGSISIAQEHIASMALQNLIGSLVRMPARSRDDTVVLFATPSGQYHEFGLMCSALMAVGAGISTVYLGSDVPAVEIVRAATVTGARAVVLGVVVACAEHDAVDAVSQVAAGVLEGVEVWVGGCKEADLKAALESLDVAYIADFDELERHLVRLDSKP